MTEEQYTEAIAVHSRLEALQECRRFLDKNNTKLTYSYEPYVNEVKLCPGRKMQPLAEILDKYDAMIREEIKREIEELTERIKQI
ncbi:MAG: hypothetical protein J6C15_06475 [Bacteroidaceae bacterium]|nr:hypothetical protein [Bacteroidaceae bacterium]